VDEPITQEPVFSLQGADIQVAGLNKQTRKILQAVKDKKPPQEAIETMNEWLTRQIEHFKSRKTKGTVETDLTPALAWVLLLRNDQNRAINAANVAKIATDVKNGDMKVNGERILVSEGGWTNDGQHRCIAEILTGKPFRVEIGFGYPRDTRFTLGGGARREAGDRLVMQGYVGGREVAGVARMLWQFIKTRRVGSSSTQPTEIQVLETAKEHRGLSESIGRWPKSSGPSHPISGNGALWLADYILNICDPEVSAEFFNSLRFGVNLQINDPIYLARERLLKTDPRFRLIDPNDRLELLFRTWNHHHAGEQLKTLKITRSNIPTPQGWPSSWPEPGSGARADVELFFPESQAPVDVVRRTQRTKEANLVLNRLFGARGGFYYGEAVTAIGKYMKVQKNAVGGVLSELMKARLIERIERGMYIFTPAEERGLAKPE
jgi:hypothetical protein